MASCVPIDSSSQFQDRFYPEELAMSQPKPARYAKPNGELIKSMLTTPPEEDGPFYAVNLMKYREHADYADGRSTALSGRQADDQYAPIDVLTRIGAEIVFIADVEQQTAGDDIVWDRIGIVRYPTRRLQVAADRCVAFGSRVAQTRASARRSS